jgi:tetratricopeptide (TPR) repeat protein
MSDSKSLPPGPSDLPEELARRIDSLYERLSTIDHFTLLGIPRSATRSQVRHAFLGLAPQFHPDKYFGKQLGPYSAKMQRVFAQMSVAHDTLANDERRAEYARTLPPPLPLPPAPSPARSPSSPDPSEEQARFGSTPPRVATISSPAPADAARARQQAFAARLAGHSNSRMRTGAPAAQHAPNVTPGKAFAPNVTPGKAFSSGEVPRQPTSPGMQAVDPQAAVDALKRRYEDSVAHARGRQAGGLVQAAEAAAAKGDFVEAARLYRAATEHSSNPNLRAVVAETEAKAKEQQYAAALNRAKDCEQKHEYTEAAANWARAFELVPAPDTAHRASLCFRRAGADLRRAAKYGEEAVKIDPHKAAYRINLALVYADLGMSLRAHGEIERAKEIDPQNAQLKEAYARIKAMK